MAESLHHPVLAAEALAWLDLKPGQTAVDLTVGAGGHARLMTERIGPTGRLIALDQDPVMLAKAKESLAGTATVFRHAPFDELPRVLNQLGISAVDAVLADLGFASDQLADAARGFSFQKDGPLDMRLNPDNPTTAADLLAGLSERELADLLWKYGEERFSRRIARRIVEARNQARLPRTTTELADLVRRCVPRGRQKIDPATRTFQALRIAVNDELEALRRLLQVLPGCLGPGGRAVIISFHSLEDRLVKQAFRDRSVWEALTKKPITPTEDELRNNPRSRSAKLRAARRKEAG